MRTVIALRVLAAGLLIAALVPDRAAAHGLWRDGRMTPLDGSPVALNDCGQVAGMVDRNGTAAVHLWQDGRYRYVTVPGSESLYVVALNNRGWVLAYDYTGGGAVLWNPRPLHIDIPDGVVTALNDAGQIAGTARDQDFHPSGVLWQQGRMADLVALACGLAGSGRTSAARHSRPRVSTSSSVPTMARQSSRHALIHASHAVSRTPRLITCS